MINEQYKDRYNNYVTIQINGTTPTITDQQPEPFIIQDCNISYNGGELKPSYINYTGDITFLGNLNHYKQFGQIDFKSHEVIITTVKGVFKGYLLPEVYNMDYTGHTVSFTINFESNAGQLQREVFDQPTNLYSITDILNQCQTICGFDSIVVDTSFSESLSNIKCYSYNFINDDNMNEPYEKILQWIASTFGMKIILFQNTLYVTSCEKCYDLANVYSPIPQDINEDVSINTKNDTCQVTISNFSLPQIPNDFSLSGATKIIDQKPMRIRQGQTGSFLGICGGSRGSWYDYRIRQIYGYQPGQKQWHFKKFNSQGVEVDEFDPTQYIPGYVDRQTSSLQNLVPLQGVYPILYSVGGQMAATTENPILWFKMFNDGTDSLISGTNRQNMMTLELPNFLVKDNTFIVMNFQATSIYYANGTNNAVNNNDISKWTRICEGYQSNPNNSPDLSSNIHECPVIVEKTNDWGGGTVPILVDIRFTPVGGGGQRFWNPRFTNPNTQPSWDTTQPSDNNRTIMLNFKKEFEWSNGNFIYMKEPTMSDDGGFTSNGNLQVFPTDIGKPQLWVRVPGRMGKLEIKLGPGGGSLTFDNRIRGVLLKTAEFGMIEQIDLSNPETIDFSKLDTVYSNTINQETDVNETFYMYTKPENVNNIGSGQLYMNDQDTYIEKLTYPYGQDKPEWNYIGLITQFFNKSQINNDKIMINDLFLKYQDRFLNNLDINPLTGVCSINTVKPQIYNITAVS